MCVLIRESTTCRRGWQVCAKSTSISSNRHSSTAYYYTALDVYPLSIQNWEVAMSSSLYFDIFIKDVSVQVGFCCICGGKGPGSYPELV